MSENNRFADTTTNKKVIASMVLVLVISAGIIIGVSLKLQAPSNQAISIDGDEQLAQNCSKGSGTPEDPYIIENHIIKSSNTSILIKNISKRLVIQNNNVTSDYGFGIGVRNSDYVVIRNNSVRILGKLGTKVGIGLDESSYCEISNNTVYPVANDLVGISMQYSSSHNNVFNNTIIGNTGIMLVYGCDSNHVFQNNISGSGVESFGISLYDGCDFNQIENNIITEKSYSGVFMYLSSSNEINQNSITQCNGGIWQSDCGVNILTNNIITHNTNIGICTIGEFGSAGGSIINNTISFNKYSGIYVEDFDSVEIRNNSVINNCYLDSFNEDHGIGIELYSCYQDIIANNTIDGNGDADNDGVFDSNEFGIGIKITESYSITIEDNTIKHHGYYGIYKESASVNNWATITSINIIVDNYYSHSF